MAVLSSWLDVWVWVLLGAGALIALVGLVRRERGARAKSNEARAAACRRCGYDLRGLEVPRCPECGTLRGFTVPLDQLGLTEEEIRAGVARRREAAPDEPSDKPT